MLVSVIDNTDKTIKYSMEYYPGDLPAKNSNNTDSWGYSNGSKQGANFYFPASYNGILYHGADKTPNLNSMRVGTLQKLKFPTGEEYEYITPGTGYVHPSEAVTCPRAWLIAFIVS